MKISDRLTTVRKSMNKNQIPFAQELGVSQSAYATYERGVREVPVALLTKICQDYKISPAWLILGQGDMCVPNYQALVEKASAMTREHILKMQHDIDPKKEAAIVSVLVEKMIKNQEVGDTTLEQLIKVAI